MEKASLFKDLNKQFIGASLATLLFATPVMADGMPEERDTKIADQQPGKETVIQPTAVTPEELKQRLDEQLESIKSLINDSQLKAQPKSFECTLDASKKSELITREECIQKEFAIIKEQLEKTWIGAFKDPSVQISFALAVLAFGLTWFIYKKQKKDAIEADRLNKSTHAAVEEIKKAVATIKQAIATITEISTNTHMATQEIEGTIKQGGEVQASMIQVNRTLRALERGKSINRDVRVGPFPDMYHYISDRIHNAEKLVVVTIPFYQFGVLGSPHGLYDFHHTLNDRFTSPAEGDKPHLIIITYDDKSRYEMARKRYSRAIHALKKFDETPQAEKLKDIFSQAVWDGLQPRLQFFRETLNKYEGSRKLLVKLAQEQSRLLGDDKSPITEEVAKAVDVYSKSFGRPVSHKEAKDLLFIKFLKRNGREQDRILFSALNKARNRFSKAVEAQEKRYFDKNVPWDDTGTPWPPGATIVKLSREKLEEMGIIFDNKMAVLVDDEIISAFSSLDPSDPSRKNRLESESGQERMNNYNKSLSRLFEAADQRQFTPETVELLKRLLPDVDAIKDWHPEP